MPPKTAPFDAAEVLDCEEAIEEYLLAARETGDEAYIAKALKTAARARTNNAIKEARAGGLARFGSIEELMADLNSDDELKGE